MDPFRSLQLLSRRSFMGMGMTGLAAGLAGVACLTDPEDDEVNDGRLTAQPIPLMVLLHGAGGAGSQVLQRFSETAQEFKVAIVAPDSRGSTWDRIVTGQFRSDVTFIDQALNLVFDRVAVDASRVVRPTPFSPSM